MQYSIATIAALATAVMAAKPHLLNTAFDVVEGQPFTIKFDGCAEGCTIVLQNGSSKDLKDYKTLTSSAEGGAFTFTPSDLPTDQYNFKITDNDSGEYNYSSQFTIEGSTVATTETSSTAVSTTEASTSTTEAATSTTEATTTTTEKTTTTPKVTTTLTKAVSTPGVNSTTPVSSAASTGTEGSTTAAGTTAATTVPNSGATRMTSSIALIAGAVMAMVYLN